MIIPCRFWDAGRCTEGYFGGRPSPGTCLKHCEHYQGPDRAPLIAELHKGRGLGDTIAKLTKAVGLKRCTGCKKRQAALNQLVPYSPT